MVHASQNEGGKEIALLIYFSLIICITVILHRRKFCDGHIILVFFVFSLPIHCLFLNSLSLVLFPSISYLHGSSTSLLHFVEKVFVHSKNIMQTLFKCFVKNIYIFSICKPGFTSVSPTMLFFSERDTLLHSLI